MRRPTIAAATAMALALSLASTALADNPIVTDIYTADPAALVHDGRMYVYTGRDEASPTQNNFVMREWHVFSSDNPSPDPQAWTHHGSPLSLDSFSWGNANAWASEVVQGLDGRFYWYVSINSTFPERTGMSIGVAVADDPLGPWTDALGGPLVWPDLPNSSSLNIDPTVLVDDDGQVYMYWGSFWSPRAVRLNQNMIELDGPILTPQGLTTLAGAPNNFWEAPWLFKRDGLYYLVYAANSNVGGTPGDGCVTASTFACIRYATATNPLGPWSHRGIVLDQVSSTTNHPAIVEFEGQWWMVYHTADAPDGGNFRRSVAVDMLFFNDDGTMQKVIQTPIPVEPDPEPSDNVALAAAPSCSSTSPWESCPAINDGIDPPQSNDALNPRWGTWPNSGTQWVQLDWPRPVKIEASQMYFFQDVPDSVDGGVKRPASWSIEYWDGVGFVELPNASGYPTALDEYNLTTFDPILTTRLRATLISQTFSGAGGVGVLEWKVKAVQPAKVRTLHVATLVDEPPDLPELATLVYEDGSRLDAGVRWKRFDEELLSSAGSSFTAEGVADGSLTLVEASVYVRGDVPAELAYLEDEELLILQGISPTLPSTVTAVYADGTRDNVHTAVAWNDTDPADFSALGTVSVGGQTVAGALPVRANVTTCSAILRGNVSGSLTVGSGLSCLDEASVARNVSVAPGAGLAVADSSVSSSLMSNRASTLRVIRSVVGASVTATNGSGRLDLVDNEVGESIILLTNRTSDAALVSGNIVADALNCRSNEPPPVDGGRPNTVSGPALGQCAGLAH
jgi:hypothetical protein